MDEQVPQEIEELLQGLEESGEEQELSPDVEKLLQELKPDNPFATRALSRP